MVSLFVLESLRRDITYNSPIPFLIPLAFSIDFAYILLRMSFNRSWQLKGKLEESLIINSAEYTSIRV